MGDGLLRQVEPVGDLGVAQPFLDQREHLELAAGQPGRVGPRRGSRPARDVARPRARAAGRWSGPAWGARPAGRTPRSQRGGRLRPGCPRAPSPPRRGSRTTPRPGSPRAIRPAAAARTAPATGIDGWAARAGPQQPQRQHTDRPRLLDVVGQRERLGHLTGDQVRVAIEPTGLGPRSHHRADELDLPGLQSVNERLVEQLPDARLTPAGGHQCQHHHHGDPGDPDHVQVLQQLGRLGDGPVPVPGLHRRRQAVREHAHPRGVQVVVHAVADAAIEVGPGLGELEAHLRRTGQVVQRPGHVVGEVLLQGDLQRLHQQGLAGAVAAEPRGPTRSSSAREPTMARSPSCSARSIACSPQTSAASVCCATIASEAR